MNKSSLMTALIKRHLGILKHKEKEKKILELAKEYGKLVFTKKNHDKQKKALKKLERALKSLIEDYEQ